MLNVFESRLTGVSLALDADEAYYFPIAHQQGHNLSSAAAWRLGRFIAEYQGILWAHNWKHDAQCFRQHWGCGPNVPGDSQVAAFLLEAGVPPSVLEKWGVKKTRTLSLKNLARYYLGMEMASFENTTSGQTFESIDPEDGTPYACDDAIATLRLGRMFAADLEHKGLSEPFWQQEMPLVDILRRMEAQGMALDFDKLRQLQGDLEPRIQELVEEWDFYAPGVLISSPKQVADHVYGPREWKGDREVQTEPQHALWADPGVRTKKGGMTTGSDARAVVMAATKEGSEPYVLAEILDEYQLLSKNLNTYTHGLIEIAEQYSDKRLHTSFNQTVARTGRLSSSGPNLQNIPVRTELGRRVKEAFVPAPGYVFLAADYSQIELRYLAHLTREGRLVDAYLSNEDIHQATADLVGCSRAQGKTINFATVYGIGPAKLGRQLGVSKKQAKEFLDNYHDAYPEVGALRDRVLRFAYRNGYVLTYAKRRRSIPALKAASARPRKADTLAQRLDRWAGERIAFNTPIQGSAGDIVKIAMLNFQQVIDERWPDGEVRMVNQVHDEITCEVREDIVGEVAEALQQTMESAVTLRVPLVAEPAWGYNWLEAK